MSLNTKKINNEIKKIDESLSCIGAETVLAMLGRHKFCPFLFHWCTVEFMTT